MFLSPGSLNVPRTKQKKEISHGLGERLVVGLPICLGLEFCTGLISISRKDDIELKASEQFAAVIDQGLAKFAYFCTFEDDPMKSLTLDCVLPCS